MVLQQLSSSYWTDLTQSCMKSTISTHTLVQPIFWDSWVCAVSGGLINRIWFVTLHVFHLCSPEQCREEASRHIGSDSSPCKELAEDGCIGESWPLCEVAACEYTHVKENTNQNEHSKPWMEWDLQASGPGSQVTIPWASCLWLGQGELVHLLLTPALQTQGSCNSFSCGWIADSSIRSRKLISSLLAQNGL